MRLIALAHPPTANHPQERMVFPYHNLDEFVKIIMQTAQAAAAKGTAAAAAPLARH